MLYLFDNVFCVLIVNDLNRKTYVVFKMHIWISKYTFQNTNVGFELKSKCVF